MRYVVYGAGAVGGTIGARLFEAGREVVLIARGAHLEALRRNGLRYGDPMRTRQLAIDVVDHPSAVSWRDDDVAVMAIKGQATEEAVRELAAVAPPSLAVVCAQNGLENERLALRRFSHVYGLSVMMPATHLEPGAVDADSLPVVGVLDIGCYPKGVDATSSMIAADLSAAGFRSRADDDVMRWKREKLLLNLNTAVRAMCGPEADDDPGAAVLRLRIYEQLRAEALQCFGAADVSLPSQAERADRWDGALTARPIPGRPRVAGSAWQSLARATGSIESDFVNGEIVLLGRLHGVATPVNEVVRRVSNELARRRLPPGSISVAELHDSIYIKK